MGGLAAVPERRGAGRLKRYLAQPEADPPSDREARPHGRGRAGRPTDLRILQGSRLPPHRGGCVGLPLGGGRARSRARASDLCGAGRASLLGLRLGHPLHRQSLGGLQPRPASGLAPAAVPTPDRAPHGPRFHMGASATRSHRRGAARASLSRCQSPRVERRLQRHLLRCQPGVGGRPTRRRTGLWYGLGKSEPGSVIVGCAAADAALRRKRLSP